MVMRRSRSGEGSRLARNCCVRDVDDEIARRGELDVGVRSGPGLQRIVV
jgi:hypothetical protein